VTHIVPGSWNPFRPTDADLKAIARDVTDIGVIQTKLLDDHRDLHPPDRVAHQYQIAGGKVLLRVAADLPAQIQGIGLFKPGAGHIGIGRISTGLGTPHIETNPDFLGAMMAFQTSERCRVDFLAINEPTAPTDNHLDFMDVLRATGESAGAHLPLIGDWGAYNLGNLVAEQTAFAKALERRMGLVKAGRCLAHITHQTWRTFRSSTAWQRYWTGIVELGGTAGKFTLVPTREENTGPGFRPGEYHLSDDWRRRQAKGDIAFQLYWISYLDEDATPTKELTRAWAEEHKMPVGTITFPVIDPDSAEARLWAALATEIGANPGNWIADSDNTIKEPPTDFGNARKIAYALSQQGRAALDPQMYQLVFETGQILADLARELNRRREVKDKQGHIDRARYIAQSA
jgi:hypothetical protein